ncbi:LptF/LptG family permease [Candidatus Pelagibacter communis]|uniref:LptF/LptG family permease n=1 Tax=Pelagibacter ubique TaxID=198252 RepID=UPI00094CF032|nr:LptF/LptG family permease [Candidatus Pelagibacter ubique]
MKKLIFRKFYLDIVTFFVASLLIVGLIVWTIQAVNYFDFVTEDGHGLKIYFFYSVLNFPKIIHRILPFIFFISIFYTILKYEFKNEIFIFWVNGVSKINFINKLIVFSFIFVFFQIILGSYISPLSKLEARNFIKNSNVDFFTSLIKEGKFINVTDGLTIFIDRKENDGSFKNIFLEETNKKNSKMIYANKGILIDDEFQKTLKLFDGRVINFEKSKINLFDFDQINFSLKDLNSKTITVPKIQEIDTKILLSCFLDIENNKFQQFKCDENLIKETKRELFIRLYKPIFIPLIVLFSCFLTLYSKNEKNYKTKVNLIFLMIFFLLVYSEVSVRYSVTSINFTIMYLLIPMIIFIIGYSLFYRLVKNV